MKVCQAIQHAHQKGIIHRDIKPSNILVTLHDGVPVPKVIDFGIAKATQGELTDKTVYTQLQQFIGTPAYMSPEQAEMSGLDIDTRSDIYALGVLLYELLTGKTPFDATELMAAGLDAMRRTIREKEPARPSTRLSTMLAGELTAVAKHRHVEPARLRTLMRGDLDWIVMKALEKDRTRRYETANGLAMDIQRHVDNEPVVARPASNLYRFQKLVRRNKLAFTAASAVVAALIIGLAVSTWMFFKENHARQRAVAAEQKTRTEAAKSQQVGRFLKDMLKGVGPSVALGRDTTMLREIVDKTAERVGTDLKAEPKVQSELYLTLADTYHELGSFKLMERMAREALRLARSTPGEENLAVADALGRLGDALQHLEINDEAEAVLRQAIAMERKLRGGESLQEAAALYHLGYVVSSRGKLAEAETSARTALAMRRKLLGNEHTEVARSLDALSYLLKVQNKLPEAEALLRESLSIRKQLFGEKHPELARSYFRLGDVFRRNRRYAEAEASYRDGIRLATKESGDSWQLSMAGLADMFRDTGRLGEAENLFREILPSARKRTGDGHPWVAGYCQSLADVLRQQGKLDEAEAVLRELLNAVRRLPEGEQLGSVQLISTLAGVLQAQGKLAEAETILREALAMNQKKFSNENRAVDDLLASLAALLHDRGKLAEAEAVWREELAMERKLSGDEHPFVANSLAELTRFLMVQEKFAEAEPLARECLSIREKRLPDDWVTFNARSVVGDSLLGQKKFAEAEPLLLSGYEGMKQREDKIPAIGKPRVKETLQRLVQLYEATGQSEKAAAWRKKLAEFEQAAKVDAPKRQQP